jgi:hypothetical protein
MNPSSDDFRLAAQLLRIAIDADVLPPTRGRYTVGGLAAVIEHLEVAHAIATDPFVAAVTAISPCDCGKTPCDARLAIGGLPVAITVLRGSLPNVDCDYSVSAWQVPLVRAVIAQLEGQAASMDMIRLAVHTPSGVLQ